MTTILAANTGNWSATGTWTGGVVPVAGDIVVANGKTVTIDTLNVTVAEVRNDTTGGAVAGGIFNMVSGGSLTANVYAGSATNSCISWTGAAGQTATVTGNIYAGTGGSSYGINCTGGNLTIGGGSQVYGSASTSTSVGISFAGTGTFTFATAGNPGSITGSSFVNSSSYGILLNGSNCTANIFATTITSSTTGSAPGLYVSGTNTLLTITANQFNSVGCVSSGIYISGSLNSPSTITVSGTIYGSNSQQNNAGIYHVSVSTIAINHSGSCIAQSANNGSAIINGSASGTINYTGNPVGNSSGASFAAVTNASTGTFNITGSVTAGGIASGMTNNSTGLIRVTRAIGNGYGNGSIGINNIIAINNSQGGQLYVEQIQFGSLGNTPVSGPIRLTANTGNVCQMITTTGSTKTLVDTAATSGVLPAASDVRLGTVYSSGNITGTCAVPPASNVLAGTPVDNTVGTAILNASTLRSAIGMSSANLDAQLKKINNNAITAGAMV